MQLHSVMIEGQPIAFRQSVGSQGAVLLLHGNSSSGLSYARQLDGEIGRQHRLVAVDLPGFGDSQPVTHLDRALGITHWARLLAAAAEDLGLADAVLVGWSLGGHVALEMLAHLPHCKGVLIFGTPPLAFPPDMAAAFLPNPAMAAGFAAAPSEAEIRGYVEAFFAPGTQDIPQFFCDDMRRADGRARVAVAESIRPGGYTDEVEIVGGMRVPLAVLQGAEEQLVNLAYLQKLHISKLWRSQAQVIAGAGHAPQWEQADAFNTLLGSFVRECEGGRW